MTMPIPELGPIPSWSQHAGQTGAGIYLLTGYREQIGESGQAFLKVTLEDAHGRATGFAWPEARAQVSCGATPSAVRIEGTVQQFRDHAQIKLHALRPVAAEEAPPASALLPRRQCPERALPALDRLAELEATLPEPLDGFLQRILLDPMLGVPFLRCRASVRHHHAFPGGLLEHSTSMLDTAADLASRTLPEDPWAPWLAQLGYLLHDLGKLRSVGEVRRPPYALIVRHEHVTLELLAPHLQWLEARDQRLATAVRYLIAYLATPASARRVPEYFIAELVATLDQWSAAAHNQRTLTHLLDQRETRLQAIHGLPPARLAAPTMATNRMTSSSPLG